MRKPVASWIAALWIAFSVAVLHVSGALAPLDRALTDLRYHVLKRPASGDIVVVQIDSQSLRELDVWPWPRAYHATALNRLLDAGASEIAYDVDFSARSTEDDDRALASALKRAGSRVILPVFRQAASPESVGTEVFDTLPRSRFSEQVQIGSVTVSPSSDGLIRTVSDLQAIEGVSHPSLFALLAGPDSIVGSGFAIDYGIDPATIPRLTFVDVLRGEIEAERVAGKKVIVGATAAELGDILAVPVYQSMAGAVLQAMAYESLIQGRALQTLSPGPATLIVVIFALGLTPYFGARHWYRSIAAGGLAVAGLELGALGLQAVFPVALPTAPWIVTVILSFVVAMARRVEAQAREILAQRQTIATRRLLMDRMVQNSFDGIVITDSDGRIAVCNGAAEKILDLQAEDPIGRPMDQILPGAIQFVGEFGNVAADQISPNHIGPREWGVMRADGTTIDIELIVARVQLDLGGRGAREHARDQTFYTFTFRNISERIRVQEAERKATEQAIAASRAKTEFLANMGHELRTPLNAIIGFADMIRDEVFGPINSPRYLKYIEDISESGAHLREIINDVLDASQIELGEFRLDTERLDLRALLLSCIRVPGWSKFADRDFVADVPDDLPEIGGNARVVKQIVIHVLSNAFKYSRAGDRIRLAARAEGADAVVITVSDTGIGIAAEHLAQLTKPFYQVDGSLARRYEGAGLGLFLVSSYVELHGGTLHIESEPGVGTTVTVRLPRAAERADSAATVEPVSAVG